MMTDEAIITSIETALTMWDTLRQRSVFEDVIPAAWKEATAQIERHHAAIEEARSSMPIEEFMRRNDEHPQIIRDIATRLLDAVKALDATSYANIEQHLAVERARLDNYYINPFEELEA